MMRDTVFRATLLDQEQAEETLTGEHTEGLASIRVAVYDIPDTHRAHGNLKPQVIDRGAFRSWVEGSDFTARPVPMFIDHGEAMLHGFALAERKLGWADGFHEDDTGLVYQAHYNLRTQRGREAFADLIFDPQGTQFSLRTSGEEETEQGEDGYEHVTEFESVVEVSQVGIGAQREAGLVDLETVSMRAAIGSHGTATSDSAWSAGTNVKACPDAAGPLRRMHAWVDPEGEADSKSSYKFPHHFVSDGSVGAASTRACSNGIAVLNGGRGGADIPTDDRRGVYSHLARHLRDAGNEAPPLRVAPPDEDELREWLADDEFRQAVTSMLAEADEPVIPSAEALRGWFVDPQIRPAVVAALIDDEAVRAMREAMDEASRPDALADFYRQLLV